MSDLKTYRARRWTVLAVFAGFALVLVLRAYDLQLIEKEFLQDHGNARFLRAVEIPASRGVIMDRNLEPLAISTPVSSVWAVPRELNQARNRWAALGSLLEMKPAQIETLVEHRMGREFIYLKRHVEPGVAAKIMSLKIPGIALQRESRRYYPAGEVTAHVVGFTNVDDKGQEGLELSYEESLRGTPGAKRVIKDGNGRLVENVESIRAPDSGKDLILSIDRRIQYLAYRELKSAVQKHKARGGSIVILEARTGEILAMVNQPSYNPNNRSGLKSDYYRNRAVTDTFEPGSTMKPFTVAAGLENGAFRPDTMIDTAPGFYKIGRHTVRDAHNYGTINVSTVIRKSSNVGASKISLSLDPEEMWGMYHKLGFGQVSGSGFPGEAAGRLNDPQDWGEIEQATMSFGYGLSTTALQLAHAYLVLATDGVQLPLRIEHSNSVARGTRVISAESARQIRAMLVSVVQEGTGKLAQTAGYSVAGKTGTVHKSATGGYAENRYLALFAGLAPSNSPQLVTVVMIDEPSIDEYYGGEVAAPIFSRVMSDALRLLNIPPDLPAQQLTAVAPALPVVGGER